MAVTWQNDRIRRWLEQYDESCKEFSGVMQRPNNDHIKVLKEKHWALHIDLINNGLSQKDGYGWFAGAALNAYRSMEAFLHLFTDPPGPEYQHIERAESYLKKARDAAATPSNPNNVDTNLSDALKVYLKRWDTVLQTYKLINQDLGTQRGIAESHWRAYQDLSISIHMKQNGN